MTEDDKFIIDLCCGGRHWWIEKSCRHAVYMDIRSVKRGEIELQPNWSVDPDIIGSYTDIPFEDGSFRYAMWDVPHKISPDKGIITKKYGFLGDYWRDDLSLGFSEIMRVLKPEGMLIFKFSDLDIPFRDVLSCFSQSPIGFTPTKKGVNNTAFFVFIKEQLEDEA